MAFYHASREEHGFRFWWHFGSRSVFSVEMNWWTHFCHAYVSTSDAWTFALALPPLAIWVTFDGFGLWHPKRKCTANWETPPREFWIPDQRECKVSIHDWTLRLVPWGKSMEWASADPWWVKGVSVDFADLLLGRVKYSTEIIRDGIALQIPMPEGVYPATAKIARNTWKRPRWFAKSRIYTDVSVPKGIPFAGKGENSWDCGDDGLFGYSTESDSLEKAIAHGVESVLKSRRRHGHASPKAIADALSA